jgi:UDP-N-acetylmuramate dehydrogenase
MIDVAPLIPWLQARKLRYMENAPLAPYTTLRIGGPAALLVEWPESAEAGQALLARLAEKRIPIRVLGAGSNLLIDDAPFNGVVLQVKTLQPPLFDEDGVTAPAGFPLPKLASLAAAEGLAGLEALAGVPGTVGGAAVMNAGCWGMEMKDVFAWAEIVDAQSVRRVGLHDANFSYRHSLFQADPNADVTAPPALVRRVRFILRREHPQQVRQRLLEWQHQRETTQPIHSRTAGSTWTNPPGQQAWKLLEACGLRGHGVGGIQLSDKHCNFLINTGGATFADTVNLLEEGERRVHAQFGVALQREIKLWPAANENGEAVAHVG